MPLVWLCLIYLYHEFIRSALPCKGSILPSLIKRSTAVQGPTGVIPFTLILCFYALVKSCWSSNMVLVNTQLEYIWALIILSSEQGTATFLQVRDPAGVIHWIEFRCSPLIRTGVMYLWFEDTACFIKISNIKWSTLLTPCFTRHIQTTLSENRSEVLLLRVSNSF